MSDKTRTRKKKGKGKKKPARSRRTAATSDRHELYELSVQGPEAEVDFIDHAWQQRRGRIAHSVREDFCGTAIASVEWVKRRRDNTGSQARVAMGSGFESRGSNEPRARTDPGTR